MFKTKVIDQIIDREGGYVNDASDSGGETNFGITVKVARDYGYNGAMFDLPRAVAFDIYSTKYWDTVNGDSLQELSEAITDEIVDTGVNMGVARAATFLQRMLNVMNKNGTLYDDIDVDGHIGRASIAALAAYLNKRPEAVMLNGLNCLQGAFYIELAERREKDERFIYGWLKNRVTL